MTTLNLPNASTPNLGASVDAMNLQSPAQPQKVASAVAMGATAVVGLAVTAAAAYAVYLSRSNPEERARLWDAFIDRMQDTLGPAWQDLKKSVAKVWHQSHNQGEFITAFVSSLLTRATAEQLHRIVAQVKQALPNPTQPSQGEPLQLNRAQANAMLEQQLLQSGVTQPELRQALAERYLDKLAGTSRMVDSNELQKFQRNLSTSPQTNREMLVIATVDVLRKQGQLGQGRDVAAFAQQLRQWLDASVRGMQPTDGVQLFKAQANKLGWLVSDSPQAQNTLRAMAAGTKPMGAAPGNFASPKTVDLPALQQTIRRHPGLQIFLEHLSGDPQALRDFTRMAMDPGLFKQWTNGSHTVQGGPPLPPEDRKLLERLINATFGALASAAGDAINELAGGERKSFGDKLRSVAIGFVANAVVPGRAKGRADSFVANAVTAGLESWLRQVSNLDPGDPKAAVFNAALGGLMGVGSHEVSAWLTRSLGPSPAVALGGLSDGIDETSRLPARTKSLAQGPNPDSPPDSSPVAPTRQAQHLPDRQGEDPMHLYGAPRKTITTVPTKNGGARALLTHRTPQQSALDRQPAIHLYPSRAHDPNGAFTVGVVEISPRQIYLPGSTPESARTQATAADWPRIAVFGWHGAPNRFLRVSTVEAAEKMAHEIAQHNGALLPTDKRIEFVLLDSCNQGNKNVLALWGTTNAQVFREALNDALERLGHSPVEVLAARDAGPLYEGTNGILKHIGGKQVEFVPPAHQRGRWDPEMRQSAAETVRAYGTLIKDGVALGAEGYVIWDVLIDRRDRKKKD